MRRALSSPEQNFPPVHPEQDEPFDRKDRDLLKKQF